MRGICIQAPEKSNLINGKEYYLFPHGSHAVEASLFPHPGSHFGTYQKSRFQIIDEQKIIDFGNEAESPKKFLARVVMPPSKFYIVGEEYIVSESNANGYYDVFFKTQPDCAPIGSYKKSEYFELIERYREEPSAAKKIRAEENDLVTVSYESKQKILVHTKKQEFTQLSLF